MTLRPRSRSASASVAAILSAESQMLRLRQRHDLRPRGGAGGVEDQRDVVAPRPRPGRAAGLPGARRKAGTRRRRASAPGISVNSGTPSLCAASTAGDVAAGLDDQRLGAEIAEVEFEFLGAVGGVQRRRGRAGRHGEKRRRHFRPVRQHDGDPIAAPDANRSAQRPCRATRRASPHRSAAPRRARRSRPRRPRPDAMQVIKCSRALTWLDLPMSGLARLTPASTREPALAVGQRLAEQFGRPRRRRPDAAPATSTMRPSSITEPSSASISIARPCSTSCSIEVLCAPMASAPAMRFSMRDAEADAERLADGLGFRIISAASARVGGKRQMSSSVAWVSALIGLKVRLPQSFIQISARTSLDDRRLEARLREELGRARRPARSSSRRFRRARTGCPRCAG